MKKSLKDALTSGQTQLNIAGIFLLAVLGFSAWNALPVTWGSALPLALIGYAAFRVVHELTFNRKNVPTLATSMAGRGKIARLLKDEAEKRSGGYTIIDLGSGRGELARQIAKTVPTANVMGIEKARIPHLQASLMQRWLGPKNLSFQGIDFWPYDCADIDAVVFYLTPTVAIRVGDKLKRELKSGSTIISHSFPLGKEWVPVETIEFRSPFKEIIYVYRIP